LLNRYTGQNLYRWFESLPLRQSSSKPFPLSVLSPEDRANIPQSSLGSSQARDVRTRCIHGLLKNLGSGGVAAWKETVPRFVDRRKVGSSRTEREGRGPPPDTYPSPDAPRWRYCGSFDEAFSSSRSESAGQSRSEDSPMLYRFGVISFPADV